MTPYLHGKNEIIFPSLRTRIGIYGPFSIAIYIIMVVSIKHAITINPLLVI
jgi:hypothetical protein